MIDRLAGWLDRNLNPGRMFCATIGAFLCIHDALQTSHSYIVVGFGVMLLSPSLADTVSAIVTGTARRNGHTGKNGNGEGRAGD